MKLSILLLTFLVTTLYARYVHQTSTNKSSNCIKHQNRINGTIKCNITTTLTPVGRNSQQFPVSTTTKKYKSGSTATKTEKFHKGNTTQKYTKLNSSATTTERAVIVNEQTTTESSSIDTRFFITAPIKECKDGLTRDVNGDCVFKFPDRKSVV